MLWSFAWLMNEPRGARVIRISTMLLILPLWVLVVSLLQLRGWAEAILVAMAAVMLSCLAFINAEYDSWRHAAMIAAFGLTFIIGIVTVLVATAGAIWQPQQRAVFATVIPLGPRNLPSLASPTEP